MTKRRASGEGSVFRARVSCWLFGHHWKVRTIRYEIWRTDEATCLRCGYREWVME